MLALESNELAVFLLQPLALLNDGLEQLTRKRAFNQIQVQALGARQQIFFPVGVADDFLEFLRPQGQPHAFLEQNQEFTVDPIDFVSNFI